MVVLIHPDIIDHKLEFEKRLVESLHQRAWFGSIREFGEFWAARDHVSVDIEHKDSQTRVSLNAPVQVAGLTLHLPVGYRVVSVEPRELTFTQIGAQVVIDKLSADATLILENGGSVR